MRVLFVYSLLLICAQISSLHAQIFPLSQNSWTNPEFVQRFLGSYGVNTRVEPELSREEATFFNELAELLAADPDAATQRLRETITPESSAALDYTLGSLLLQAGDHRGAINNYQVAIKKFPNFMRAYKNLGLAHLQSGDFKDALPMLVKAIELGDGDGNTYGLLGYAYLNTDRPQAALDAYRMAYVLRPENRDWKIGMAQGLNLTGQYREAAALLRELIDEFPSNIPFYLNRANALIALGNEMAAASHLEIVKRLDQATVPSLSLLGDIYMNESMPFLAVENYIAALKKGEGMIPNQAVRTAGNLVMFGAYPEAKQFINEVTSTYGDSLSTEHRVALLNLSAEVALASGDDETAAQLLEEVIQEDPLNGRALILLGNFHNRSGATEEAVFYYERAAEISSVQVDALIQHARMMVGNRDFAKAVTLLERAQSIRPTTNVENYLNAVRNARDLSL